MSQVFLSLSSMVGLAIVAQLGGCSGSTISQPPSPSVSATPAIPQYPPMQEVSVKVCGDIPAPVNAAGERCQERKFRLWGQQVEAKLLQSSGVVLTSRVDNVYLKSEGCYPASQKPKTLGLVYGGLAGAGAATG